MTMSLLAGDPKPATTIAFSWGPQAQLRFHKASFLLENIAHLDLATWPEIHDARLHLAEALSLEHPHDSWERGRAPLPARLDRDTKEAAA